jgi:hypothetical protein
VITIEHRFTSANLFKSETAQTLRDALVQAVAAGANLRGANLEGANLEGANLEGAYLRGAYLRGANLEGANLEGAYLRGADLEGAYLRGANLEGANLEGANLEGAYLRGANLEGAYLEGANLEGAYLRGADLEGVKQDVWSVLDQQPNEVSGLLAALKEGRVDGSTYEGKCACLVGTIANVAQCDYRKIVVKPDSTRPAEIWFLGIRKGDTPANNVMSKIAAEWVEEWMSNR